MIKSFKQFLTELRVKSNFVGLDTNPFVGYATPKPPKTLGKGYHIYNTVINRVAVRHGEFRHWNDAQRHLTDINNGGVSKLQVVYHDGKGNFHTISPQGVMQQQTVKVLNLHR